MNGRIFDPVLARFLSADPNIDGVSDSQGYNRYSYVHNNPLNATDPSGYLSLKEVLPAIVAVVVTVVVTIVTWGAGTGHTAMGFMAILKGAAAGTLQGAATAVVAGAAAGGFASGFSGSLLNGGSIGDAFKAGVIGGATGAFTAWASMGIAGAVADIKSGVLRELTRAMSHGTVGGLVSEAQGGEFRHGFYSSAASSAFGHSRVGQKLMASNVAVSTATSMAIGGTVSVIGGGKFANGAVTSAFQHLFNQVASEEAQKAKHPRTLILLQDKLADEWAHWDKNTEGRHLGNYKVYDRFWDEKWEINKLNQDAVALVRYADETELTALIRGKAGSFGHILIVSHGAGGGFSVEPGIHVDIPTFAKRFDEATRLKMDHICCEARGKEVMATWEDGVNQVRAIYGLPPRLDTYWDKHMNNPVK